MSYRNDRLRHFKEPMVSHWVNLSCVKQVLNSWATQNIIILQDWKEVVTAVVDVDQKLQWLTWWREEAVNIEQ